MERNKIETENKEPNTIYEESIVKFKIMLRFQGKHLKVGSFRIKVACANMIIPFVLMH